MRRRPREPQPDSKRSGAMRNLAPLDVLFPIHDAASARLMLVKARHLKSAGIIGESDYTNMARGARMFGAGGAASERCARKIGQLELDAARLIHCQDRGVSRAANVIQAEYCTIRSGAHPVARIPTINSWFSKLADPFEGARGRNHERRGLPLHSPGQAGASDASGGEPTCWLCSRAPSYQGCRLHSQGAL